MTKRTTPADHDHQAVITFWCEQWAARMEGERYPFNGGRDAKAIKQLRTAVGDDAKLRALMQVYLELDDPWINEHGHSLHVFAAQLPLVMQAARTRRAPAAPKRLRGLAAWAADET